MKAIGYTKCAVCGGWVRGYRPRARRVQTEHLATFRHSADNSSAMMGGFRRGLHCAGSYRPGVDSRTDAEWSSAALAAKGGGA